MNKLHAFILLILISQSVFASPMLVAARRFYREFVNSGARNNCFFLAIQQAGIPSFTRGRVLQRVQRNIHHPQLQDWFMEEIIQAIYFRDYVPARFNEDMLRNYMTGDNPEALERLAGDAGEISGYLNSLRDQRGNGANNRPMGFNPAGGQGLFAIIAQLYGFRLRIIQIEPNGVRRQLFLSQNTNVSRTVTLRYHDGHFTYLDMSDEE